MGGEQNSDGLRIRAGRLLWVNRLGVLPLALSVGAWIGLLIEELVAKSQSVWAAMAGGLVGVVVDLGGAARTSVTIRDDAIQIRYALGSKCLRREEVAMVVAQSTRYLNSSTRSCLAIRDREGRDWALLAVGRLPRHPWRGSDAQMDDATLLSLGALIARWAGPEVRFNPNETACPHRPWRVWFESVRSLVNSAESHP